jgi:hypothetical protein
MLDMVIEEEEEEEEEPPPPIVMASDVSGAIVDGRVSMCDEKGMRRVKQVGLRQIRLRVGRCCYKSCALADFEFFVVKLKNKSDDWKSRQISRQFRPDRSASSTIQPSGSLCLSPCWERCASKCASARWRPTEALLVCDFFNLIDKSHRLENCGVRGRANIKKTYIYTV